MTENISHLTASAAALLAEPQVARIQPFDHVDVSSKRWTGCILNALQFLVQI